MARKDTAYWRGFKAGLAAAETKRLRQKFYSGRMSKKEEARYMRSTGAKRRKSTRRRFWG